MNRKTNLFYNAGQDSNFLTFSNYTEALTGNMIATNSKMFPAKFICLYVPELDEEYVKEKNKQIDVENLQIDIFNAHLDEYNAEHSGEAGFEPAEPKEHIPYFMNYYNYDEQKKKFINSYLVDYYENKLATLRDFIISKNEKVEDYINPLDYLLKAIYMYVKDIKNDYGITNTDADAKITHIGYICEQEYNGTFMDNMCIIEASAQVKEYSITDASNNPSNLDTLIYENDSDHPKYLHGWEAYYESQEPEEDPTLEHGGTTDVSALPTETETPSFIKDHEAIYENASNNKYTAKIDIELTEINSDQTNIEFNLLIPLFNVYNWDQNSQSSHYYNLPENETDPITGKNLNQFVDDSGLILNSAATNNHYDIPMGIWISDKKILLERDTTSPEKYIPSWSLCISSQFKPFPYSNIPTEVYGSTNPDIYGTFAMIMSKQGYILDEFNSMSYTINSLSSRLDYITTKLNALIIPTNSGSGSSSSSSSVSEADIDEIYDRLDTLNSQLGTVGNQVSIVSGLLDLKVSTQEYNELNSTVRTMASNMQSAADNASTAMTKANTAYHTAINTAELVNLIKDTANNANTFANYAYERTNSLGRTFKQENTLHLNWDDTSGLAYVNEWNDTFYISIPDIIYSYNAAYNYMSGRMANIDGIGLGENENQSFRSNVTEAIKNIELRLNSLREILISSATTYTGINTETISADSWANVIGDTTGANHGIGEWQ